MMILVLVAGVGLVLAGLLATVYGISVQLSTGNTLITAGVMGVCTGAIMLALWVAVRELKTVARRLGAGAAEPSGEVPVRSVLPTGMMREPTSGEGAFPSSRDEPAPVPPPPWQDEAVLRDHPIPEPMFPEDTIPPPPVPKPKRGPLFSSTSRKERDRAQTRTSERLSPDLLSSDLLRPKPPIGPPTAEPAEPPLSFDDARLRTERAKPGEISPPRRGPRTPAATEPNGTQAQNGDQPTVLKSGIVDGMAYSLYSDGSIEAQMPEGLMRFASIDELRAHLDQRS